MYENTCVSPRVFTAIQNVDINELSFCSHKDIRPILPCLVRMSLISPLDITKECVEGRKQVLTILSGIESVNSIIALLSIDFHALETDVRQEQQLRLEHLRIPLRTFLLTISFYRSRGLSHRCICHSHRFIQQLISTKVEEARFDSTS